MGIFGKFFTYLVGSRGLLTPLFYEDPLSPMLPTTPFSNFGLPLPPPNLPVTSNLHSHCHFCCLVSLAEWVITPHDKYGSTHIEPWYLSTRRTLMYVFCNKAPSLLRSDTMWFFTGTWIWYHTQNIHNALRSR